MSRRITSIHIDRLCDPSTVRITVDDPHNADYTDSITLSLDDVGVAMIRYSPWNFSSPAAMLMEACEALARGLLRPDPLSPSPAFRT